MKKNKKTIIVLLDAHAIIHRAYHALPHFATSAGVPSGALYGLASMLFRMIEELRPDHIVAAFDLPKPTFRHHAYEAYKGTRSKSDDALIAQLQTARQLFAAFGISCIDAEGFEADDVIGTLVTQYKKNADTTVIIASGDMDTMQLIEGKKVQVFTLKKSITETVLYDETAIKERFGFSPKQLTDFKGLRGDPSDNIIGVPGIGEKTATLLIQEYGSVEHMYEVLEKKPESVTIVTPRIKTLLQEHKDEALFSKTLATIRRDAPVSYELPEQSFLEQSDEKAIRAFLSEYEFSSLIPRMTRVFNFSQTPTEEIDPLLLKKASIALWVLYSEQPAPSYDQIIARSKKQTLAEAYDVLIAELQKNDLYKIYESIELPILSIITTMEQRGVGIDRSYFESLSQSYKKTIQEIEEKITTIAGGPINVNSPKQLSELLFTTLALTPKGKQKASGAFTTNAEVLESLKDAHPVVSLILEHRELQKLVGTYIDALCTHAVKDSLGDRVHASFLQHGTATGRFSSQHPNLQNIPTAKEIRHGFIAAPHHVFISCDYSQIELRVLAMMSDDTILRQTFETGGDIHAAVASTIFSVPVSEVDADMRRAAKVVNFGILYGMGVSAVQKNLGTTREKAAAFYADYFNAFPTISDWLEQTKEYAKKTGYTKTIFGRKRFIQGITSTIPFMRSIAERTATNAPIQGTAADIIKIAIMLVQNKIDAEKLSDKIHLVLQIHDELVYEVHESVVEQAKKSITHAMESVFDHCPLPYEGEAVPLKVSCGVGKRLDEVK